MRVWIGASMMLAVTALAETQELDSLVSPGPLSQVHSDLAGLTQCVSCHTPGRGVEAEKCLACHKDLAERIDAGRGFHRGKGDGCTGCHLEHQGKDFQLLRWIPSELDHAETGYPLVGLHRNVEACEQCHKPSNAPARNKSTTFLLNDSRCLACHTDVHQGRLGEDCQRCHPPDAKFNEIRFDHGRTAFPLEGAHRRLECESCHPNQKWQGIRFSNCTDCHRDPHQPTLGADCRRCHETSSWRVGPFDHERTRYPLRGQHQSVTCSKCHENQRFKGIAFSRCGDCHEDDPHWGQFDKDCSYCHGVEGFRRWTRDHDDTLYPLTGKHLQVDCVRCHRLEENRFPAGMAKAVRYKPLETLCASCHRDSHLGQFPSDCGVCHSTVGLDKETLHFDHDEDSRFKLLGRHASVACSACHKLEKGRFPAGEGEAVRFLPLADKCSACHANVHDPAWWKTSTARQEADCQLCHGVESFVVESFDHGRTSLPLEGGHASLSCDRCHAFASLEGRPILLFEDSKQGCADCHRTPHSRRLTDCLACHSTSNWRVRAW